MNDDVPPDLAALIVAAMADGVMDWELARNRVAYNRRWKELLGYDPDTLADTPDLWRTLCHPGDLPGVLQALEESLEGDWPFNHIWRMRHWNGGWRHIHCRAFVLRDGSGKATRWVGVFSDVSDLIGLRQQQEAILNATQEGILGIDEHGRITFANPAASTFAGRSQSHLIGTEVASLSLGAPEALESACRAVLKDARVSVLPRSSVASSTPARLLDGAMAPIIESGQAVGAVLSLRDVTMEQRLEAQLQGARKLEAVGQLAAGVAHEINTPMQFIGDNLRFIEDAFRDLSAAFVALEEKVKGGDLAESAAELRQARDLDFVFENAPVAIARSLEGVSRVSAIVAAMKEFSHPGEKDKQEADLNSAIRSTVIVATNAWKFVAEVRLDLDPTLPKISCLVGGINQVILNLIVNAAHAIEDVVGKESGQKGTITVSTRWLGDAVEVRVADTGAGIPEHVRPRLFEPFFTTKAVGKGTGQGLALARSVVNQHGGTISFETEMGRGTSFVLHLPAA